MTLPSPEVLQQFTQGTQGMTAALRQRLIERRASGARLDPEDQRTLQLIYGQLQEVSALSEEILARLRGCRMALQRAMEGLDREERRLEQALRMPVSELRQALEAAYGGGGAP